MHPTKVDRAKLKKLTDLPNIGPAGAADLELLGILRPDQLLGRDPYQMYQELCQITQQQHDPCVIDVFISVVRYMQGEPARVWWDFSLERRNALRQNQE